MRRIGSYRPFFRRFHPSKAPRLGFRPGNGLGFRDYRASREAALGLCASHLMCLLLPGHYSFSLAPATHGLRSPAFRCLIFMMGLLREKESVWRGLRNQELYGWTRISGRFISTSMIGLFSSSQEEFEVVDADVRAVPTSVVPDRDESGAAPYAAKGTMGTRPNPVCRRTSLSVHGWRKSPTDLHPCALDSWSSNTAGYVRREKRLHSELLRSSSLSSAHPRSASSRHSRCPSALSVGLPQAGRVPRAFPPPGACLPASRHCDRASRCSPRPCAPRRPGLPAS
jgi:hypothetical protein